MNRRTIRMRRAVPSGLALMFIVVAASSASAQPRWGRPNAPRSGACFYRDPNFQGDYFCAGVGEDIANMPSGMNDKISSIRTFGNVEVEVFQDVRFRGHSERFGSSVRNLKEDGWNDRLSSIHVNSRGGGGNGYGNNDRRDNDRRDNDGRYNDGRYNDGNSSRVTRRQAEEIVRRAYLTVLRREPDPGSAGFVDRVLRDHWTQDQLERELRKSEEYRHMRK